MKSVFQTPVLPATFLLIAFLAFYAPAGKNQDSEKSRLNDCPPVSIAPLLERKNILIKDEHFGEGSLEFFPGIAIVHLYGNPYERGYQHGAMLKAEINTAIESLQRSQKSSFEALKTMSFYKDFTARPRFLKQELLGMADGAEASMWEIVQLNRTYLEYGSPWQEDEKRSAPQNLSSFATSELSRQRWHSAGVPGWMLVVHHPQDSPPYLVLTRPGAVFAMAGMRKSGCCLAGPDVWENRAGLPQGLCGASPGQTKSFCTLSFPEADRKIKAYFFGESGLVCLTRERDRSFGALDMESFTWRPRCPACRNLVQESSK